MSFWNANCDQFPPSLHPLPPPANPNPPPAPAVFPQCFNLRGNACRNILIGPGITNLDFSVFNNNRVNRISENFNVQFPMEIFNIMNHANFASPQSSHPTTANFYST